MDASQFVNQQLNDPNDQRQLPQYNPLAPENVAAIYAREKFDNAKSYATAPGDAMMGRMDPMSEEGFKRVMGLGMMPFTGAMPMARAPANSVGMFMRARPDGPAPIAPTFKGAPPLQEIADNMATLHPHNLNPLPKGAFDPAAQPVPLSSVLRHNRLYEQDPTLGEIPTMMARPGEGRYDTQMGMMYIDPTGNPGHQRANALENLQHAISHRENLPISGTPDQVHYGSDGIMGGLPGDTRAQIIEKLAGNQMAKATRARRDMTPTQRKERPPRLDTSVEFNDQIVHRKKDWE